MPNPTQRPQTTPQRMATISCPNSGGKEMMNMTAIGMTQPAGRFFIQFAAGVSHLTIWY